MCLSINNVLSSLAYYNNLIICSPYKVFNAFNRMLEIVMNRIDRIRCKTSRLKNCLYNITVICISDVHNLKASCFNLFFKFLCPIQQGKFILILEDGFTVINFCKTFFADTFARRKIK